LAADISFYLDENLSPQIAEQLARRGITAVTARDLGLLGDSDENHLARAAAMGYVLCTHDTDYLKMAGRGVEHAGVVFGIQERDGIGEWVRGLERIHGEHTAEYMQNHVEYL